MNIAAFCFDSTPKPLNTFNVTDSSLPPNSQTVPIHHLVGLFNDKATSYKFLLFGAILESIKKGNGAFYFDEIAITAIASAWSAVHSYKLNLGTSDQMTKWITQLDQTFSQLDRKDIAGQLEALFRRDGQKTGTLPTIVSEFSRYVPYRLLTPFFSTELRGLPDGEKNQRILELSQQKNSKALYRIETAGDRLKLTLNDGWFTYLTANLSIIEGWLRFNYLEYLQRLNPTVIALSAKLEFPIERDMTEVTQLFRKYFKESPSGFKCPYSGTTIERNNISHDHFLPWSFLGSDPLYNFIPTTASINSSKSDNIPAVEYLPTVANFYFEFFQFLKKIQAKEQNTYHQHLRVSGRETLLEWTNSYQAFYLPLFESAKNHGFSCDWRFRG